MILMTSAEKFDILFSRCSIEEAIIENRGKGGGEGGGNRVARVQWQNFYSFLCTCISPEVLSPESDLRLRLSMQSLFGWMLLVRRKLSLIRWPSLVINIIGTERRAQGRQTYSIFEQYEPCKEPRLSLSLLRSYSYKFHGSAGQWKRSTCNRTFFKSMSYIVKTFLKQLFCSEHAI
jgi:hypothetical protein